MRADYQGRGLCLHAVAGQGWRGCRLVADQEFLPAGFGGLVHAEAVGRGGFDRGGGDVDRAAIAPVGASRLNLGFGAA